MVRSWPWAYALSAITVSGLFLASVGIGLGSLLVAAIGFVTFVGPVAYFVGDNVRRERHPGPASDEDVAVSRPGLMPTVLTVLQEEEFRHATMPIIDVDAATSVGELRKAIYEEVEAAEASIIDATSDDRRTWYAVLSRVGAVVTIEAIAVLAGLAALVAGPVKAMLAASLDGNGLRGDEAARIFRDLWPAGPVNSALTIGGLIALLYAAIVANRAMARTAYAYWHEFEEAVSDELRPLIRSAINEFANSRHPTTLLVENAPGLAEANDPERLVDRPQFKQVEALIERLGATTIAVSGDRGVGKTTLLRYVEERMFGLVPAGVIRFVLSAPVNYDPRDFLIHLYLRLCDAVIAHDGGGTRAPRAISVLRLVAKSIAVLALAVLAASLRPEVGDFFRARGVAVPESWAVVLLAMAAFGALYFVVGRTPAQGRKRAASSVTARAESERRRLAYLRTVTTERSGVLDRLGFKLGWRAAHQLAEQPVTLPELVDSYRSFAREVGQWLRAQRGRRGRLVIGIDEVDRIADQDEAERFLNSIKGIFGSRDSVYVVTVPRSVLARFERRVIHARPAVDNAFDEIVTLDAFTYDEAIQLLRARVIGFPDAFIALAHAVSGGNPRDLVRVARTIVRVSVATRETELARLVPLVLAQELGALVSGIAERLHSDDSTNRNPMRAVLADRDWPPLPRAGEMWWGEESVLVEAASRLLGTETGDDRTDALRDDLATAMYFFATVHDLFVTGSFQAPGNLDRVASARGLLATSPETARRELDSIRTRAQAWA
ncbi:hypothetical protein Ais01nite_20000 [Asanoa ishikariensis]|nr:hypothetical protein Ais01nite_20000 [Asanoa ishikariensis]